ncbi:MAG: glutamate-1-semialdehyde 2,1-aminomutase [Methanobrevibacter woesei]|uniref:glutamate-1-semialdehyde 2,1-aminomutase n=1 Tax=Methanobrevibacter woesei TaxID=190976 RepID=UPI0023F2613A|nr:glutamate-1-semialdehyde 2,1-aminomutase [Methanobrevibacter woesei]MCI7292017.1 glutamate-1-semialdehyde 2,1-aminomutase [Methanobrevibacter woesei]
MNSQELFEESKKIIPGGVSSPVRAFKPYPFFVAKGEGSHIYDVDGNSYIDHCLAYGPLILGHADKTVVSDLTNQLTMGTAYGAPTENEIKLSREVINRIPSAEMVRFTNSGTEATMSAIRVARGFTKRDKIVKFEGAYHGAHDYCLVKGGSGAACLPDSLGIPVDTTKNTLTVPFNDEEALTELIEKEGENIACIIMEVVMGNIGCVEPKDGYLEFLRKITEENGIVLIFDEVITGFRLATGGAQEYYGVTPDMTTLGKIVGGGLPMGAFCGKKEIMELVAPNGPVYQAGTFSGNPISVQAGLSTLKQLNKDFYTSLNKKGEFLRSNIRDIVDELSLEISPVGLGSMFQIYFNPNEVTNYAEAQESDSERFLVYFRQLLKEGVFIPPSQFECNFISSAHEMEDLEKTANAIRESLKVAFEI